MTPRDEESEKDVEATEAGGEKPVSPGERSEDGEAAEQMVEARRIFSGQCREAFEREQRQRLVDIGAVGYFAEDRPMKGIL